MDTFRQVVGSFFIFAALIWLVIAVALCFAGDLKKDERIFGAGLFFAACGVSCWVVWLVWP